MPFNRALGLKLERYEKSLLSSALKPAYDGGNWAQSILHGGSSPPALDVARRAGMRGQYADPA